MRNRFNFEFRLGYDYAAREFLVETRDPAGRWLNFAATRRFDLACASVVEAWHQHTATLAQQVITHTDADISRFASAK